MMANSDALDKVRKLLVKDTIDNRRRVKIGDIYYTASTNQFWIMNRDTEKIAIFEQCDEEGNVSGRERLEVSYGGNITFMFTFIRNIHDGNKKNS